MSKKSASVNWKFIWVATALQGTCTLPLASLTKLTYLFCKRRFTYAVNGCIAKFKSSVDAALALPIFYAAKGADAAQISALDISKFGNVRLDYFDDGKHIAVSGFRLEPFKTHFETLGLKRCANGWIAEVNQDDPEKIKDNLMDLCDHKKAEFVVRSSFDEMLRHSRKSD